MFFTGIWRLKQLLHYIRATTICLHLWSNHGCEVFTPRPWISNRPSCSPDLAPGNCYVRRQILETFWKENERVSSTTCFWATRFAYLAWPVTCTVQIWSQLVQRGTRCRHSCQIPQPPRPFRVKTENCRWHWSTMVFPLHGSNRNVHRWLGRWLMRSVFAPPRIIRQNPSWPDRVTNKSAQNSIIITPRVHYH